MESAERNDLVQVMIKWQEKFDEHTRNEDRRVAEIRKEIKAVGDNVNHKFDAHTKDEMIRFGSIQEGIESIKEAMAVMSSQVAATHEAPCPHLKSAILDEDYTGHRIIHEEDKVWDERVSDFKWYVIKALAGAGVISLGGWLLVLVWSGVLHGPAK